MLTGAPGSGKSALADILRELAPGVAVIDMDDFLEPAGSLTRVDLRSDEARSLWPAYNDLCLTMVATVVQSGVDCVLLTPLTPDEVDGSGVRATLPTTIQWGVLDCADGVRLDRLRRRGATEAMVDDAISDAADLRAIGCLVIANDGDVRDAAVRVQEWIEAS